MRLPGAAIAGGGIGGLTAALCLAARGISASVFERSGWDRPAGAGIQVSPNAYRVLAGLGLGPRLERAACEPEAIAIRAADGRALARLPLGAAARARYGAPYLVVHRADLQALLLEAAREFDSIALHPRTHVVGHASHAGGVTIDTRAESGSVAAEAGVLIGADGVHSRLRAARFPGEALRDSGRTAWRAAIAREDAPPALRGLETGLWLGRRAHLVHYPIRRGAAVNIVAIVENRDKGTGDAEAVPTDAWSAPGEAARLAARLSGWAGEARELIAAAGDWSCWRLADRAPRGGWGEGRVTLLGDAAHPALPFLAQGGALAIEDAAVLAAELARVRPDETAAALRRYERLRAPRTGAAVMAARRQGRVYHAGGLMARARDLVLAGTRPERLLARQDWLYCWRPPE